MALTWAHVIAETGQTPKRPATAVFRSVAGRAPLRHASTRLGLSEGPNGCSACVIRVTPPVRDLRSGTSFRMLWNVAPFLVVTEPMTRQKDTNHELLHRHHP